MYSERRQFERLDIPEQAIASTETGIRLGRVVQVSGGGLRIQTESPEIEQLLRVGKKLRILIQEPPAGPTTTIFAEVRYLSPESIGLQFATP